MQFPLVVERERKRARSFEGFMNVVFQSNALKARKHGKHEYFSSLNRRRWASMISENIDTIAVQTTACECIQ